LAFLDDRGVLSEVIACRDCGAFQTAPRRSAQALVTCFHCDSQLERRTGRRISAALALAATTFLLLIPANLLPFLSTTVLGASRQSYLVSSFTAMWRLDWPLLAIIIGLFVVVFPLIRFGLLTVVLSLVCLGRRPPWLGVMFRWSNRLQPWAMPDVFLLGLWVAYARLSATVTTILEPGALCFIGAGLAALFTRAVLDKAAVWRAIEPQTAVSPARPEAFCVSCPSCDLVIACDEGERCPRCAARLSARVPGALPISVALTLAGLIFYLPANIYPIATIPIGLKPTGYTVLGGVLDLLQARLFGLALLVFAASFAIPFIKLIGLSWCIASVLIRSRRWLPAKTKTFRVIEEIGRWSMVDPFVIAVFVPVTQFNAAISSSADEAAPFFTLVVVLTIIAAQAFDPRLMWDAARSQT
jgi:paraquat-inducible protein A